MPDDQPEQPSGDVVLAFIVGAMIAAMGAYLWLRFFAWR